jgi:hypothetical protein
LMVRVCRSSIRRWVGGGLGGVCVGWCAWQNARILAPGPDQNVQC